MPFPIMEPAPGPDLPPMAAAPSPGLRPASPTAVRFNIFGPRRGAINEPIWSAVAELVQWTTHTVSPEPTWFSRSARNLFVDRQPTDPGTLTPLGPALLPGTMIARCRILSATVTVSGIRSSYQAVNPDTNPVEAELLLQASVDDWERFDFFTVKLDQAICVGGSIPLATFQCVDAIPDVWKNAFPFFDITSIANAAVANLTLSSSGLTLDAKARLDWMPVDPPIPVARYLVEVRLPTDPVDQTSPLVVLLDRERLGDHPDAATKYREAFAKLADTLVPHAVGTPDPTLRRQLRWTTLTLTNPSTLPGFYWDVRADAGGTGRTSPLRFDPGQWTLLISDQPLGVAGVTPRGVLTTSPEVAVIKQDAGTLRLALAAFQPRVPTTPSVPISLTGTVPSAGQIPPLLRGRLKVSAASVVWVGRSISDAQHDALQVMASNVTFGSSFRAAANALLVALEALPRFAYLASKSDLKNPDDWVETIGLRKVTAGYDALDAARTLRAVYQLPTPDPYRDGGATTANVLAGDVSVTVDGKVHPPVLWGFLPLDDGWAQLPFLNITEQIYLDALPAPTPASTPNGLRVPLLAGGASFGIDRSELFNPDLGEPPWNITLLDADDYASTWTMEDPGHTSSWRLTQVDLHLARPELTMEGLLWLATGSPSAFDALPGLDNWLTGLKPVSLNTPRDRDLYPSPFLLIFDALNLTEIAEPGSDATTGKVVPFSMAELGAWSFTYAANMPTATRPGDRDVYTPLLLNPNNLPFDTGEFWSELPLVWRRHAHAPMIQTLPMTQSASPPNYPSPSRQLVPFELHLLNPTTMPTPGDWRFASTGVRTWPVLADGVSAPPAGWKNQIGLALASLGLPGLTFDPNAPAGLVATASTADQILPVQFHHGLPYLDEIHALAQLPKDEETRVAAPSAPPSPLLRADYLGHWRRLGDLALFAAADADQSIQADGIGTALNVKGLVEPLQWPATAVMATGPYPGSLAFKDSQTGQTLTLNGDAGVNGLDALRGFEGRFSTDGANLRLKSTTPDPSGADYTLIGGSMAASHRTTDGQDSAGIATKIDWLRDQRGLFRTSTAVESDSISHAVTLVHTTLQREGGPLVALCALSTPLPLTLPDGTTWKFWFRDLPAHIPVKAVDPYVFDRVDTTDSPERRGVNDPSALSRDLIHLNGYTWRIGDAGNGPSLAFGPLRFFPLSLEHVEIDSQGALLALEVVGRLQLPIPGGDNSEQINACNAVRMTFHPGAGGLTAIAVEPFEPDGPPLHHPAIEPRPVLQWPLDNGPGAPVMLVSAIGLTATILPAIEVHFRLQYFNHGALWTLSKKTEKSLVIGFDKHVDPYVYDATDFIADPDNHSVHIVSATLTLDFSGHEPHGHKVAVQWSFRWGKPEELRLVAVYDEAVLAQKPDPTMPPPLPSSPALTLELVHQNQVLILAQQPPIVAPNLNGGALQVQWAGLDPAETNIGAYQVLPGMHLIAETSRATTGFGIFSFTIHEQKEGVPLLQPRGGFLEAIFSCDWGQSLQEPQTGDTLFQRAFGSSAGKIDASYTSVYTPDPDPLKEGTWGSELLLNGLLEVKNLVSWPLNLLQGTPGTIDDNIVTIPAARLNKPLDHLRHTIRVLLDQHTIGSGIVVGSDDKHIFLEIASGKAWTALAAVEHQLVAVHVTDPATTPALDVTALGGECRWTTVQEVRFCAPDALRALLIALNTLKTTEPGYPLRVPEQAAWLINDVKQANAGYMAKVMIDALAAPTSNNDSELLKLTHAVVIEASVSALLRMKTVEGEGLSDLQYLPVGTSRALLSSLSDFESPTDDPASWFLLSLPMLGRLQAGDKDGLPAAPGGVPTVEPGDSLLQIDPIVQIDRARPASKPALIAGLTRHLANWAEAQDQPFGLAEFDLARHRFFARLDPSSLRESWFRLNLPAPRPPVATRLSGVMAAPTSDSPGTLGRPEVLGRVYDPRRTDLPPKAPDPVAAPPTALLLSTEAIIWSPDSLLVVQTDSQPLTYLRTSSPMTDPPPTGTSRFYLTAYGFLGVGAQILASGLVPLIKETHLQPAVTLMPARSKVQPVGIAVSPFLSLAIHSTTPDTAKRVLAVSDLVVLDVPGRSAISLATELWHRPPNVDTDPLIRAWAREIQGRFAPDSAVAVVRLREIFPSKAGEDGVVVRYRFLASDGLTAQPRPPRRAPALRTSPAAVRSPQGQYGGAAMPPALAPFEVAPPQVRGVQPLRLKTRPDGSASWPWGYSALRLSVRQTEQAAGVAGLAVRLDPKHVENTQGRLWWQSLSHHVQYAMPQGRKVLPALFRARAISSLLPDWPATPLPPADDLSTIDLNDWQPVLPGGYHVLIVGARPGVPFVFREQLQVQDLATPEGFNGHGVASGAVPIQHRMPRPIPLPPNAKDHPENALQTWAGAFDVNNTLRIDPHPADTAYLASGGGVGLDLVLASPKPTDMTLYNTLIHDGRLPSDWDGARISFQAVLHGSTLGDWKAGTNAVLTDGTTRFAFALEATTVPSPLSFVSSTSDLKAIKDWLFSQRHGAAVEVNVSIGNDTGASIKGYRQSLSFPLRIWRDPGVQSLPLRPEYTLFEDPEYNRRLVSNTAHKSTTFSIGGDKTLTLAADRTEYNASGKIHYAFFREPRQEVAPANLITARVSFFKVGTDGLPIPLNDSHAIALVENNLPADPADMDLVTLQKIKGVTLAPGDILQIVLSPNAPVVGSGGAVPTLTLNVAIVARPVVPVPEAGYALLRIRKLPDGSIAPDPVESVRFAWGPNADHIELIDAGDLRREIVRRRAVFRWTDTPHLGRDMKYAIQKIAMRGSTHFPDFVAINVDD